MKSRYFAVTALLAITMSMIAATAVVGATEQKPLSLQQFEWHQPLTLSGTDAIYRFDVPQSVYEGASRSDLGDLRIFNASGEVVPHALLQYTPPEKAAQAMRVQQFPVYFEANNKNAKNENISIQVMKREDGSLISAQISPKQVAAAEPKLAGYVLDASAIKQPIVSLLVEWPSQPNGMVFQVNVETSDDLQSWRSVANNAQLLDLNHAGHQLHRNRIALNGSVGKYLRVRFPFGREAIAFSAFSAELTTQAGSAKVLSWTSIVSLRTGEKAGEFLFESPGIPVASLRINLPQNNTLAPVKIFHRANEKDAWHEAVGFIAYRLTHGGQAIVAPAATLDGSQDRQWLIAFDQGSGGIGQGMPQVELGWMPQQGIFVARGDAPFLMAYGNRDALPNGYSAATLVPGYKQEQFPSLPQAQADKAVHANPGAGGPPEKTANWRVISLWAILIIGVLALGLMAWKLLGQMNKGVKEDAA